MNLATKFRPVDFSTARCTTPKAPLHATFTALSLAELSLFFKIKTVPPGVLLPDVLKTYGDGKGNANERLRYCAEI